MADEITPHGEPAAIETPIVETPPETDWKTEARKWEQRAKENLTAAKANEAAAKRLAEFEESQKTEAQKLQEERDAARIELATERSARLRAEVAADKGIPASLLSGSTQEELEASADALIAFKGVTDAPAPVVPSVPTIGTSPQRPGNVPIKEQIAAAEAAGDRALVSQLKAVQLGTTN